MNWAKIRDAMDAIGVSWFKLPEHLVLVDELASTKIDKKAMRADIDVRST